MQRAWGGVTRARDCRGDQRTVSGAADDPASASTFGRIVVGVDRRQGGRDALALAELLRSVCGGELVAVYVYPFDRSVSLDEADAVEAGMYEEMLAELEQELAGAIVSARPLVVADAVAGRALQAIAERDGADAIVVGAPHRAGADRILGGDVAAGTMRGAPCAVAVAPPGFADAERGLANVGVGFDGSAEAREALRLAGRVARAAAAALHVISVASGAVHEHEAAAVAEGGAYEHVEGGPAAELARRGAGLDLLVVGSRAHGPVRRLLLGSTSTRLVREASCPVLIVPRPVALSAAETRVGPGGPVE
jgi:nucleotide-binding universal stress UspA family protein